MSANKQLKKTLILLEALVNTPHLEETRLGNQCPLQFLQ